MTRTILSWAALALLGCVGEDPAPTSTPRVADRAPPALAQVFLEPQTLAIVELRDEVGVAYLETDAGTLELEVQVVDGRLAVGEVVTLDLARFAYYGRADACRGGDEVEEIDLELAPARVGGYVTEEPATYCGSRSVLAEGATADGRAVGLGIGFVGAARGCPLLRGPWCRGGCVASFAGVPWPGACKPRRWIFCACRPILILPFCPPIILPG